MQYIDPYSPEESCYECVNCGRREVATEYVGRCPDCGGPVRNIAIARE